MEFFDCIPLGAAREMVAKSLEGVRTGWETVGLGDALGRVTAEPVIAAEDLPPFSRSSVDGFAVRSADTFGASEGAGAFFTVTGEVSMGQEANIVLEPGQAVAVPTGGMLPDGADAVVMIEYTEQPDPETLLVLKTVAPGENVVARGEDIATGCVIVEQGTLLGARHIGALAACGATALAVRLKPRVAIISSGDELVDISERPLGGQIRDVNSYALAAMLEEWGCIALRKGIVRDNYESFLSTLTQAVNESDMVIISGGSSVGVRDFTVRAMQALPDMKFMFHGLSVKPGKPTIYGTAGKVSVFGLPGHPVAAMAVASQLVKAAVSSLQGMSPHTLGGITVQAKLLRNVPSAPGRDDFINVSLTVSGGVYQADPILGKSGLVNTIAQADGIMHIPSDKSGFYSGEFVEITLYCGRLRGRGDIAQQGLS